MPTSDPGSRVGLHAHRLALRRGFTLLELLLVLAIVAITAGVASLALRDSNSTQLEREAVRLAALLEMARAESRVTGTPVRWLPEPEDTPRQAREDGALPAGFRFVGLSRQAPLARHWLQPAVTAQVPAPGFLVLGPEAILPRQRVLLRLEDQVIEISSDGLGPFEVAPLAEPVAP